MIQVISGFPGVGKSTMPDVIENEGKQYKVVDLESTPYSWHITENGVKVRHPDFPFNYMDAIQDHVKKGHLVMVSSHAQIRQALQDALIEHAVVYPSMSLKREFIARYKGRGNDDKFIELVSNNWYDWIEEIDEMSDAQTDAPIVYVKVSNPNLYLADIVRDYL